MSHYHYRVETNQTGLGVSPIPFEEWVRRAYGDRDPSYMDEPTMFMPQREWLVDESGIIAVDFVGRFERLEEDFALVCKRLKRPSVQLPHLKRSKHRDYRSYYSAASAELVGRVFAADVAEFGYAFDGPTQLDGAREELEP